MTVSANSTMTVKLTFAAMLIIPIMGCNGLKLDIKPNTDAAPVVSTTDVAKKTGASAKSSNVSKPKKLPNKSGSIDYYSLCLDCLLIDSNGIAVHAQNKNIKGALESISVFDDSAQFKGWATDTGVSGPVERIMIFSDFKLVYQGHALEERYDIAQQLGDGGTVRSGFNVILPKSLFAGANNDGKAAVRLYAVAHDGSAAEIVYKKSQ